MVYHSIKSKLPEFGTNIFSVMTELARQHHAINLSQGFPGFDGPEFLKERAIYHIQNKNNQYAPMIGIAKLREQIAQSKKKLYDCSIDPETNITITSGGMEAIFCAIQALIQPGDEVIIFEPSYDCYEPAVKLCQGIIKRCFLKGPDFAINWDEVQNIITEKTKLIVINNPHNPLGTVLKQEDLNALWSLVKDRDIFILSDEVYEHLTYDQLKHQSILKHPKLFERSFVIFSFGKTYHMTGWKIGYCIAPDYLTTELRRMHQFVTFSVPTPLQWACADMMEAFPNYEKGLAEFFQKKRDLFVKNLQGSRFRVFCPQGSYFALADFSQIKDTSDLEFSRWLTEHARVASIPVSVFSKDKSQALNLLRFCFAKEDTEIREACLRLKKI